jgi:hypothetical protein
MVAKSSAKSLLAYRTLHFKDGALVLEDAVLFDINGSKSSYFLRSEEIALKMVWSWPLSFFIHVKKPHIVISPEHVQCTSSSQSAINWSIELEEGVLEWADDPMPSSQFSLLLTSDKTLIMGMSWERGVLEVEKKGSTCRSAWSEIPFDVLWKYFAWSKFSLPISGLQGVWSGSMEIDEQQRTTFTACGKNLVFEWEKMHCGGSIVCEGVWEKEAMEKIRLSLEDGHLFSQGSEIQNVEACVTYGANLGIKCEGHGLARKDFLEMPFEWEAKSCFVLGKFDWASGNSRLGKLVGHFSWNHAEKIFSWEELGKEEAFILQGFVAHFIPGIKDWILHSGTLRGSILFEDLFAPRLIDLEAKGVGLETGSFGFEASVMSYRAENWRIETFRIYRNAQNILQGNAQWRSEPIVKLCAFEELLPKERRFSAPERSGSTFCKLSNSSLDPALKGWDCVERPVQKMAIAGDIAGLQFAGHWEWDGRNFMLSIPQIEGEIPSCFWSSDISGKIAAEEGGFECTGSLAGIETWKLSCRVFEGRAFISHCTLSQVGCSVIADPNSIDLLSVKGLFSVALEEHVFDASFFAPKLQWKGDSSWFDVRLYRGTTDFLRLKGSQEKGKFQLDPLFSHLLGEPLFLQNSLRQEGGLSSLALETEVNCAFFQSYLWQGFPQLGKIHLSAHLQEQGAAFSLIASDWTFQIENKESQWNCRGSFDSYLFDGLLSYKGGLIGLNEGRLVGPGLSFDFEGKVDRWLDGNLILRNIQIEGNQRFFSLPFEGNVEGQAQVSFNTKEIESDLDLSVKDIIFQGFSLENMGPLHIYYSSLRGALIKGLDCRIHKENFEAYAKIDLVQFDKSRNRWSVQKAKTHFPSDWIEFSLVDKEGNVDCLADFSFAADFSDWSCVAKKILLPIGGSMHHFQNFYASSCGPSLIADALLYHKEKWAKISLEIIREANLVQSESLKLQVFDKMGYNCSGKISFEELDQGQRPLLFHWSFQKESGLLVHFIEGAFGGIDATFHALEAGRLLGTCRLDFRRLSEWIPPNVAKSFQELKMGKGYELKGNLQIDPKEISNISFQGIFSGKQIELAGSQFRTLLAKADLHFAFSNANPDSSWLHIEHLKISDSAGVLKIDNLWIQGEKHRPWTIEMPQFIIEELRPSLLIKPGSVRGPISPLVVRQFKMLNFCGLLDDGKTYCAEGELSFINSFKREQTVFDLPANVFGRIIGLDLELLIPVKGELTFVLKDGYFNLDALRNTYSEGGRSEFFLIQSESNKPRMDLDGNLQILVKLKQFVLFSLTEAFMISIDGKLNDPNFRLQKKKRFL